MKKWQPLNILDEYDKIAYKVSGLASNTIRYKILKLIIQENDKLLRIEEKEILLEIEKEKNFDAVASKLNQDDFKYVDAKDISLSNDK